MVLQHKSQSFRITNVFSFIRKVLMFII